METSEVGSVYISKPSLLSGIPTSRKQPKTRKKQSQDNDKFYRVSANYQSQHDDIITNDVTAKAGTPGVVGSSITKPVPPRTVTLKFNRELSKQLEKRTNTSETRKKLLKPSTSFKPVTKSSNKVFDTTALTSRVYPNDVLSSLRKLNLIEPFLHKSRTLTDVEMREKSCDKERDSGLGTLSSSTENEKKSFQERIPEMLNPPMTKHSFKFDKDKIAESLSRTLICDNIFIDDVILPSEKSPDAIATTPTRVANSNHRNLSYVAPPTATVVDISTGGVLKHSEPPDYDVIMESHHNFGRAPPSFYYNRKIKKRREEDEMEIRALREKAREHIRSILNSTSSDKTVQSVRKPSHSNIIDSIVPSKPRSKHDSPILRPMSSPSMTSSSASSNEGLPRGPNPTPSLQHNRFQIFPTSHPDTYHAYTSPTSQPTVINMEEFLRSSVNAMRIKRIKSRIATNRKTVNNKRTLSRDNHRPSKTLVNCSLNISAVKFLDDVTTDETSNDDDVIQDGVISNDVINDDVISKDTVHDDVIPDDVTDHVKDLDQSTLKESQDTRTQHPLEALSIMSQNNSNYDITDKPTRETMSLTIKRHPATDRLSPLKGVRLLRRKISVTQYENPDSKQSSIVLLLKGLNHRDDIYKLNTGTNTEHSYSPLKIIIPAKSSDENDGSPRSRIMPRFKLSSLPNSKIVTKPLNSKSMDIDFPVEYVSGVALGDVAKTPMNVNKLLENQDPSFHLLKEGGSQSLSFIETRRNQHRKSEAGPAEPKHTKRRRRAQLGRSEGSNGEVRVKIAAGGGFKSNMARYSLILRQKNNLQKILDQVDPQNQEKMSDDENQISMVKLQSTKAEPTTIDCSSRLLGRTRSRLKTLEFPHAENPGNYPTTPIRRGSPEVGNPAWNKSDIPHDEKPRLLGYNNSISPFNFSNQLMSRSRSNLLPAIPLDGDDSGALPDTGTASYRLTHDVSFDEGSRYHSGYAFASFDEQRMSSLAAANPAIRNKGNLAYLNQEHQNPIQLQGRLDTPSKDRHTPVTYKETMPLSLVRIEERLNFDTSLGRHPATSGFPVSTITRGQSAQGGSHPANTPTTPTNGGTITTFRLHKERQNWNYRTGDLSVNGGGYYGSTPIQPGGRAEPSSLGPLSISPASNFAHKMAATRDKSSATKTRLSSRYGSRNDGSPQSYSSSTTKECPYADPCISAPPSFQQRLTELSLLESETIKYERNRKLKRKKNQDKDL